MFRKIISRPFILLTLELAIIIILFQYSNWLFISVILLGIFIGTNHYKVDRKTTLIFGILFPLIFLIYVWVHNSNFHQNIPINDKQIIDYTIEVDQVTKYTSHDMILCSMLDFPPGTKLLCRLDSFLHEPLYSGDRLLISCKLNYIKSSGVYSSFDPAAYYGSKHIQFTAYTTNASLRKIERGSIGFVRLAQLTKDYCSVLLDSLYPNPIHKSLMNGLLLGIKQSLPDEIVDYFKHTGTSHILAVSGMHLTLLYGILIFILSNVMKVRNKKLNFLLTIIFIWLFTFITGAGAAVMRAAVMFSLIEIGKLLKRDSDIYSITFSAGFFMLIWNPCTIYDIGFQLSFCAVLSIVLFNPYIKKLYASSNKYLNSIWNIISVTTSVQVLTMPITLFYFNQFPSYFLLANVIWVPLSSLIMVVGLIAMPLYPFVPKVCILFTFIAGKLIDLGVGFFVILSKLPFFYLDGLHYFPEQIIFLLTLILIITYHLYNGKPMSYYYLLILPIFYFSSEFIRYNIEQSKNEIIFFEIKKNDLLFVKKRNAINAYTTLPNIEFDPAINYINKHQAYIDTLYYYKNHDSTGHCISIYYETFLNNSTSHNKLKFYLGKYNYNHVECDSMNHNTVIGNSCTFKNKCDGIIRLKNKNYYSITK